MPAVAALPLRALVRQAPLKASPSQATAVPEWLDSLRPGWGARFTPVFEHLGLDTVARLRSMVAVEFDALETQLKQHGLRQAKVRHLRRAIEALTSAAKENSCDSLSTSPGISACLDYYESPMAAYFGESKFNLSSTLDADSPLGNVTNLEHNGLLHASPKASFFNGVCRDLSNKTCSESGLPCKSPMSAFFDGDDDWESIMSPESDVAKSSPAASVASNLSTSSVTNNFASSPGSSFIASPQGLSYVASSTGCNYMASPMIMQVVSPCFICVQSCETQNTMKSALRSTPNSKGRRVTWSAEVAEIAEVTEKSSLCLVDLLDENTSMTCPLARRVWLLSQDAEGTFEVQKALADSINDEERAVLAAELRGHVIEATQCPHANHVLRKVITSMSPPCLNFIVAELLSQGPQIVLELARHRYGCRILEGLLTHCPFEQVSGLVEALWPEAAALCMHMYGNFVMQQLLEHAPSTLRSQLFQVIHAKLVAMGLNFYGSTVLVKAMSYGNDREKLSLSRAILSVNGLLSAIAKSRHGKAILELVLDSLEDAEKHAAMEQSRFPPLKAPKCGRGC